MLDYKAINWTKAHGDHLLFQDISFIIREGEHIALVGRNGCGKSTLIKIIAGLEFQEKGEIEQPKSLTIALASQESHLDDEKTILEEMLGGREYYKMKLLNDYEQVIEELEQTPHDEKLQRRFQDIEAAMTNNNIWELETEIHRILTNLGLNRSQTKIKDLSGGQKKRVSLAKALLLQPDLLLLDEPTNHLDFHMVSWLEDYLKNYKKSVLFVTHDRYFLDHVANQIFSIENKQLKVYTGNYSAYLEQKAKNEILLAKEQEKKEQLYKKELAWMRTGAKARSTKQEARIKAFRKLEADVEHPKQSQGPVQLDMQQERLGKRVIEIDDLTLAYEDKPPFIQSLQLLIQNGDRIGIIGPNGIGKTSLLNAIYGDMPCTKGQINYGETVKVAYFRQDIADLPLDQRMIDYILESNKILQTRDGKSYSAVQMLERFLFKRTRHGEYISRLSGGEKKRLYLLKLLMTEPNVLLLDEPTNDLDVETLTILEDYLLHFQGSILTVSHDRYFLDKIATKLFVLKEKGEWELYHGNFSDNWDKLSAQNSPEEKRTATKEEFPTAGKVDKKRKKNKLTYQEKKDWENLEDEIIAIETELEDILTEMQECASDYSQLYTLQNKKEELEEVLAFKMAYWDDLSERV